MVTTCGNQEASAYIHHYQESGYHPLVINEYHSKLLLSSLLRTGSAYSSNGIIEELEQIFTQLKNTGNIRFRGDSAFIEGICLNIWKTIRLRIIYELSISRKTLKHP